MTSDFDSVLMIGFGGPTRGCCRKFDDCPGEAFCFVHNVVGDRSSSADRIREVSAHYEHFGGVSPFSFFSQKQAGALEMALEGEGIRAPVYVGYRFWTPFVKEALVEMNRRGLRHTLAIALAPHRAKVSFEAYRSEVESARKERRGLEHRLGRRLGGQRRQVQLHRALSGLRFDLPGRIRPETGRPPYRSSRNQRRRRGL